MADENQEQAAGAGGRKMADEKTSKDVAAKAAKILRDPNATAEQKSVAASALNQAADKGVDENRFSQSADESKAQSPEPYKRIRFRANEKSPTVEVAQGEYRRVFKKDDEPFAVDSEEEFQMLRATGHFVEHHEAQKESATDEHR